MLRRRPRVICSSDEEEEPPPQQTPQQLDDEEVDEDIEVELQAVTINSSHSSVNPNRNSNSIEPIQFHISEDDMDDVYYDLPPSYPSPPSPPLQPSSIGDQLFQSVADSTTGATATMNSSEALDCPISSHLRSLGLRLRREWLDSCIREFESSVPGFSTFDAATKAKHCFEKFLFSDLNYIGVGVLPENVHNMHLIDLVGPFVLQVDETVNISCPLRQRYHEAHCGVKRCLKLSLTDGVQRVFAMEYRPIKDLQVLAPSGLKVVICNVNIRHGLLMLVPEVFKVLGGSVTELDEARQRLVQEVNKPPRGKRTKIGVLPPLATRATSAAWSSRSINVPDRVNVSPTGNATSFQAVEQGNPICIPTNNRTGEESVVPFTTGDAERIPSVVSTSNDTEVHMFDEVEHPFVLTREKEIPFTYLASLSAKWAAMEGRTKVQGKIKCFLTGVKGFQYLERSKFELQAYVDDGSLISEISIDHNVVQNRIGHSPDEVTAALASSDKKRESKMKETMKLFQRFLVNFEGTMIVEMNEASYVPIAIEMNQGCPASDAWLLLRRLKSFASQLPQNSYADPIYLSP